MARTMRQDVTRPDSLRRTRATTSTKVPHRRITSQLKVGAQLAYDAGKANAKFYTWGGMKILSGVLWLGGKTTQCVGRVSRAVGVVLEKGAKGVTNLSIWLFG